MSSHLSIADVLMRLETQIAAVRDKEAFHAQQEAFHREQRTALGAELEDLTRRHQAFKASAIEAVDVAALLPTVPEGDEDPGVAGRPPLPLLVQRVLQDLEPGLVFVPAWVTAEVNRRFGKRLRRPTNRRLVSIALRRMVQKGQLHVYQPGRPHVEARYVRKRVEEG